MNTNLRTTPESDMGSLLKITLTAAILIPCAPAQSRIQDFKFELETLGGRTVTQEHFQGSALIVDIWGTWCPPCRAAIPELVKLYAKYKHHGLEIVGLNYERGGNAKSQAERVRKFAVDNGITYALALGDEATRGQVPSFGGYPTMLMFKPGLKHDNTKVGFGPGDEQAIEKWIRETLGLDAAIEIPAVAEGGGVAPAGETEQEEPEPKEEVPEGKIFRPGQADVGFSFEAEDVDGNLIEFSSMRGKPVVVTVTSTWDDDALPTAQLLSALEERYSGVPILAGCMERQRARADKVAAIKRFREANSLSYPLFPADLAFGRKIHRFAGLPTILVFDADGKLVLRELGTSEAIRTRVTEVLDRLTGAKK